MLGVAATGGVVERGPVRAQGQAIGAPTVATGPARAAHVDSVRLTGTVVPNGLETRYRFEYGLTTAYGTTTPAVDVGAGTTPVDAIADVAGLRPGTAYHYRLVATNAAGTAVGADATAITRDPRLNGRYRVRLKIVGGGKVFGQRKGAVVHRTYRFDQICNGALCGAAELNREGRRGRFASTLGRVGAGVYEGTERFGGGRCDNGLRFHSATEVRIAVARTAGDRASRINGNLNVKPKGCVRKGERARLRGKAVG